MIAHLLVTFGIAISVLSLAPVTFGGPVVVQALALGAGMVGIGGVIAWAKGRGKI